MNSVRIPNILDYRDMTVEPLKFFITVFDLRFGFSLRIFKCINLCIFLSSLHLIHTNLQILKTITYFQPIVYSILSHFKTPVSKPYLNKIMPTLLIRFSFSSVFEIVKFYINMPFFSESLLIIPLPFSFVQFSW